jgi:hypothetical protein
VVVIEPVLLCEQVFKKYLIRPSSSLESLPTFYVVRLQFLLYLLRTTFCVCGLACSLRQHQRTRRVLH